MTKNQYQIEADTPALKPFDGMKCTQVLEDDGTECIVAQFYDNVLNGENRIHRNVARFIHAESMESLLREAVRTRPEFDAADAVPGAALVDWFAQFRTAAKSILAEIDSSNDIAKSPQSTYLTEFPDFGPIDVAIPHDFHDDSWWNDACPSFTRDLGQGQVVIWVDYADPSKRERPDINGRFKAQVLQNSRVTADTASNTWTDILKWVRVEIIKDEVLDDVRHEIVPADVQDFASLDDFRDANTYGGFCDDHGFPEGWKDGHMTEEFITFIESCNASVNEWIMEGHLLKAAIAAGLYAAIDAADSVDMEAPETLARRNTSESPIQVLSDDAAAKGQFLPGACSCEVGTVSMRDIVGDYAQPWKMIEWAWVTQNARFQHVRNGQGAIFEFIVHLDDITQNPEYELPERLKPVFAEAIKKGLTYVIFN